MAAIFIEITGWGDSSSTAEAQGPAPEPESTVAIPEEHHVSPTLAPVSNGIQGAEEIETSDPSVTLVEEKPSGLPSEGVYLNPVSQEATVGQTISINVEARLTDCGISGSEIELEFDPAVFQVTGFVTEGVLGSNPLIGMEEKNNQAGVLRYALARRGPTQVTTLAEVIAIIDFKVMDSASIGSYNLILKDVKLTNEKFEEITGFVVQDGSVKVVPLT